MEAMEPNETDAELGELRSLVERVEADIGNEQGTLAALATHLRSAADAASFARTLLASNAPLRQKETARRAVVDTLRPVKTLISAWEAERRYRDPAEALRIGLGKGTKTKQINDWEL